MVYLSSNLKWIRSSKGYSQQRFSNLLGLKRGTYVTYEKSRATPSITIIANICSKLEVTIDELLLVDMENQFVFASNRQVEKTAEWLNTGNRI